MYTSKCATTDTVNGVGPGTSLAVTFVDLSDKEDPGDEIGN